MLTRDQILAATDLRREEVAVPEWGGSVFVGTMSGAARDAFEASIVDRKGKPTLENMRAKLVAFCLVGEDGRRLFTEKDVEALGEKSSSALSRIVKVAQRLNSITEEELEDAVKN